MSLAEFHRRLLELRQDATTGDEQPSEVTRHLSEAVYAAERILKQRACAHSKLRDDIRGTGVWTRCNDCDAKIKFEVIR